MSCIETVVNVANQNLIPVTNVKTQLTLAYYTSILRVSTVLYTNSIVSALSEARFSSCASNILQKNPFPTKCYSASGFSSCIKDDIHWLLLLLPYCFSLLLLQTLLLQLWWYMLLLFLFCNAVIVLLTECIIQFSTRNSIFHFKYKRN